MKDREMPLSSPCKKSDSNRRYNLVKEKGIGIIGSLFPITGPKSSVLTLSIRYDMLYSFYVHRLLIMQTVPPKPEHIVPMLIGRVYRKYSNNDML
jgi:hypothetical protein